MKPVLETVVNSSFCNYDSLNGGHVKEEEKEKEKEVKGDRLSDLKKDYTVSVTNFADITFPSLCCDAACLELPMCLTDLRNIGKSHEIYRKWVIRCRPTIVVTGTYKSKSVYP